MVITTLASPKTGADGCLCGPIKIRQISARMGKKLFLQVAGEYVASTGNLPQRCKRGKSLVLNQSLQHRRHKIDNRNLVLNQKAHEFGGIEELGRRRNHQPGAS